MAPINPAYLELRLSGGAGNASPDACLGGVMSDQRICSHSVTGLRHITGVSVDDAPGCPNGPGTLSFSALSQSLVWTPPHGVAGVPTQVLGNGRLAVPGSAGFVFLTVDTAALPTVDQSDTVTVSSMADSVFDGITQQESFHGNTAYRCVYVLNTHDTDSFDSVSLYISAQPNGPDDLFVGLDPAGTGNGSSSGVAVAIPSESTPPDPAVIFSQSNSIETALNLGPLQAGQARAVWLQRVVPAGILTSLSVDIASLAFGVEYRVPA
ncbi:MAG: Vibrio phage [Pseudomonadota bacterium]